jgi:integrase
LSAARLLLEIDIGERVPVGVAWMVKAAKEPKLRALLMMATTTGLRASELRGLRWSDADLLNARELQTPPRSLIARRFVEDNARSSRRM